MRKIILFLFPPILILSCQEDFEFEYPTVFTGEVVKVDASSATFSAKIIPNPEFPIIESGFVWSIRSNDNEGIKILNQGMPSDNYTLETNYPLLLNKIYYVRAYAKTENFTVYGREVSFNGPEGEIDTGAWSEVVYNSTGVYSEAINSSITIKEITYLMFEDGSMYKYDHILNEFNFLLSDNLIRNADVAFVNNEIGYVFSENNMYKFDQDNLTFTLLSTWPSNKVSSPASFLLDGEAYIGLGRHFDGEYTKEFWCYDITDHAWRQIADFPGDFKSFAYSFSLNEAGYVGGGFNFFSSVTRMNDLWQYDPREDRWRQKESLPFINETIFALVGTAYKESGYGFYKKSLYEYNPVFDTWEEMAALDIDENVGWVNMFTKGEEIFILQATEYRDEKYFKMWSYAK